jgi:ABC-2 type transport system permease protein
MLEKEVRVLMREPMVIAMIVLPFIIYSSMAPFYGGIAEQTKEAAKLEGVKTAILVCDVDQATRLLLETIVSRQKTNMTIHLLEGCNATSVLAEGYDIVAVINGSVLRRSFSTALYVRGSIEKFTKTMALPATASAVFTDLLARGGEEEVNMTVKSYVYLNNRLYSFEELSSIFNSATIMIMALFFILFPAASLGAVLIGAEREERMLDVLLSLPVRRRDIALTKATAALIVSLLAAASAIGGYMVMLTRSGLEVPFRFYFTTLDIVLYAVALLSEAFFVVILAMLISIFTSTIRGAQAVAPIVAFPALIPFFMLMTGLPLSYKTATIPYMASIYSVLAPLIGRNYAVVSIAAQFTEALIVAAVFIKVLESEIAISGPETLKQMARRLRRRR